MPKPIKDQTETTNILIWPNGEWMYDFHYSKSKHINKGLDFITHKVSTSLFSQEIDDIAAYVAAKQ